MQVGKNIEYKYGLLKYSTGNIGDEIQSLAAEQFLPRVDVYVDRDNLGSVKAKSKIKLILNGWFTHNPDKWPPSPAIEPLFVSFHISPKVARELTVPNSIRYFKLHEPIGCRDYYTRDLLRGKGVDAYFSGCLTLTLGHVAASRIHIIKEPNNEILLVDLDQEAINALPHDIQKCAIILTHNSDLYLIKKMRATVSGSNLLKRAIKRFGGAPVIRISRQLRSSDAKMQLAKGLLQRYAGAKLVITSRLHCALPCVAFSTPVFFVRRDLSDPRFKGLLEYLRAYSLNDFKKAVQQIDWENPGPNPKSVDALKESLIQTCKRFLGKQ